MNPQEIALIVEKNSADIEAIVAKVGLPTLLALLPHILAILDTLNSQKGTS